MRMMVMIYLGEGDGAHSGGNRGSDGAIEVNTNIYIHLRTVLVVTRP